LGRVCAIIVAAGWGRRFEKDVPKQFYEVNGESPIKHAVRTLLSSAKIDGVLCVIPDGLQQFMLPVRGRGRKQTGSEV
jgi:2-C-methyl-D-erythritol 4-phosphate cytidylyltransferase